MPIPVSRPCIVSLRGLGVTLTGAAGAVEVLRGIDLDLAPGETVSVVGPSGAGKTTLLMIIGGLERPSAGRVTVAGHDLRALDEDALARFRGRHVGIVFQSFHLIPTMTALENVAAPRELAGEPDAFKRAREELAAVGLDHRLGHYPGELSGGEQQRVAIARALVNRPDLLLADEPTGNLDAATGDQVIDHLFARSRDKGATLVLITHEARLAGLCGRTIRIADGRIEAWETKPPEPAMDAFGGPDAPVEAQQAVSPAPAQDPPDHHTTSPPVEAQQAVSPALAQDSPDHHTTSPPVEAQRAVSPAPAQDSPDHHTTSPAVPAGSGIHPRASRTAGPR